jgi:hypothetical protein
MGPGLEVTTMSKPKKTAAPKQAATEEKPAPEAATTKTTKKTKPTTKPKATADTVMPKAKAADDLVVFAFRLSADEREEIHSAAGSARASRFVRAVALAAARRDVSALQAIMSEAHREAGSS